VAVRGGQHVNQKQLIGRVGCTGWCTGPHLHFGLKKGGRYISPTSVKYEPGKPVDPKYHDRWKEARTLLRGKLDAVQIDELFGPKPPSYGMDLNAQDPASSSPTEPMGHPSLTGEP